MAILNIRTYPDDVLKRKAQPVQSIDEHLRKLVNDMAETMYKAPGVGLAAPQVGVSKRLIVVDAGNRDIENSGLVVLFNPEIISSEGSIDFDEGCLSLPGFQTPVPRFSKITVRGLDIEGREIEIIAQDLLAVVLQHEIDHLDGVLLLDRAGMLKREFYKKRVKKHLARDERET